MQASRETALDELRDHGHPYASVRVDRVRRQRAITGASSASRPSPGRSRVTARSRSPATQSVSDNVVRRQLTFKPGDLYQLSKLRESQRRLYGLELFQFANVEPIRTEEQRRRSSRRASRSPKASIAG